MLIQMSITPEQLLVIRELLYSTRLGMETMFGHAVTELAHSLEEDFGEDVIEMLHNHYGRPELSVDFNNDDGLSLNIL